MDTASLVCGIIGVLISCLGIGLIPSIVAIILGAKFNSNYGKNGKATTGIILGSIGTTIAIIILIAQFGGDNSNSKTVVSKDNELTNDTVVEESQEEKLLADATVGQRNAYKKALSYLRYSPYSREGLIYQLEFEKFSNEDATWAVDHCDADWYEQAEKKAKSYLKYSSYSHDGLVDQLEFEGFTNDEAVKAADKLYGTDSSVNDTSESGTVSQSNALKSAKSYLKYSSYSYDGLVNQLEYEGYSNEDAVYAADNCGADWNEQAAKSAKSYLKYGSYSRNRLIEQLEYEGYTSSQAEYAVNAVGL